MVGLLGDMASLLGPQIGQHLKQPFVEMLIITLQNQPDADSRETAKWALDSIKQAILGVS